MFSLLSNVFPIETPETDDLSAESMPKNLLFIADQFSCKTSLLVQLIETLLLNSYEDIHYIVVEKKSSIGCRIQGMAPIDIDNGSVLHFLKVYYLSTYESLINHLRALQNSNDLFPIAVIIDDINHYIKDSQNSRRSERQDENSAKPKRQKMCRKDTKQLMAEFSAFFISVGNICGKRADRNTLIVTGYNLDNDSDKESAAIESIGRRFYDQIWSLRTTGSDDLIAYQMDCKSYETHLKLNMSLENDEIVLNSIDEKN